MKTKKRPFCKNNNEESYLDGQNAISFPQKKKNKDNIVKDFGHYL